MKNAIFYFSLLLSIAIVGCGSGKKDTPRPVIIAPTPSTTPVRTTQFFQPSSSYRSVNDSPFIALGLTNFQLEDFEDATLTPGWSVDRGEANPARALRDSVDGDDGTFDNNGSNGNSLLDLSSRGITVTFNPNQLGGKLPTHVGVVWTDGRDAITFEAFGPTGESLGTLTGTHADNQTAGSTVEDRFYGVSNNAGISKIRLQSSSIELDHLQYGFAN
jgi:hypothetical protein